MKFRVVIEGLGGDRPYQCYFPLLKMAESYIDNLMKGYSHPITATIYEMKEIKLFTFEKSLNLNSNQDSTKFSVTVTNNQYINVKTEINQNG